MMGATYLVIIVTTLTAVVFSAFVFVDIMIKWALFRPTMR